MKLSKRYVLLNALALIMLGGSCFVNFLMYIQVKKSYVEINQTRLDPLGLSYYPINSQKFTGTHPFRVVFFGDSRAFSWPHPNIKGYEFINRGIPSQTSVQTIDRFSYHVRSLKPNVVIIQVGINDLKTVALFPEHRNLIVANCQTNIKRIVGESRDLGAVVIITTIFPVGNVSLVRKPVWSDEIAQTVKETNAYIATLADNKTIVFDTFAILADRQGMMLQKYRTDELHLNEKGYMILNEELVRLIHRINHKLAFAITTMGYEIS